MHLLRHCSLILFLAWLPSCWAQGVTEDKVKSAFVLNFAKFVAWPAGTTWQDNQTNLCVVGDNVLGGALLDLDGRKAGGHELHVVEYEKPGDKLKACHLLFIGISERRQASAIIGKLADAAVLTISDMEDFASKGGGIGLAYRDDRIVFEVNLAATKKAGLHLPGQLLSLAARVFGR